MIDSAYQVSYLYPLAVTTADHLWDFDSLSYKGISTTPKPQRLDIPSRKAEEWKEARTNNGVDRGIWHLHKSVYRLLSIISLTDRFDLGMRQEVEIPLETVDVGLMALLDEEATVLVAEAIHLAGVLIMVDARGGGRMVCAMQSLL